jgi:hypothetical protein
MAFTRRTLTDEELVHLLRDSPWERGLRESREEPPSSLKFWLCNELVSRSAPNPPTRLVPRARRESVLQAFFPRTYLRTGT